MSRDMDVEQLRALVSAAPERSTCPPAELLARAAAGEASAAERRRVADHLASCSWCSEEYRTALALGPWARTAIEELGSAGHPRRSAVAWRPLAYAAAALLVIGAAGALTFWDLRLRSENARLTAALQESTKEAAPRAGRDDTEPSTAQLQARLAEASAPALNTPIIDLLPRDGVRGSRAASLPRIPAGATYVTFVMTTAIDPVAGDHELEIVDSSGVVRWRGAGLQPNADRAFTATVPGALLPAGRCHVRLYERRNQQPHLVADYSVVVE